MAQDLIRFDLLVQDALRSVLRTVLVDIARDGLPGEHHFYIAFDTNAPGVQISARLREQYPEEMTIVLQYQFWDLEVTESGFSIGLSFNGVPEQLRVPFAAVKGFFDPSVQFGLQFEPAEEGKAPGVPSVPAVPASKDEHQDTAPADEPAPAEAEKAPEPVAEETQDQAEVVSLDAFRKKS